MIFRNKNVLIVSPVSPVPANSNGTAVIVANIAEVISRENKVTIISPCVSTLTYTQCQDCDLRPLHFYSSCLRLFFSPFLPRMAYWARGKKFGGDHNSAYDLVIVFRLDMGFFLKDIKGLYGCDNLVFFPIDLVSELYRSMWLQSPRLLRKIYCRLQFFITRFWERKFLRQAELSIFVSSEDARKAKELSGVDNGILGLRNGVEKSSVSYSVKEAKDTISIAFSGDFSYPPNKDAANFIITEIADKLSFSDRQTTIYIVGRNSGAIVGSQGSREGVNIVITGEVDSIDEWLIKADIFVCPLFAGAGMKNKVLKAMALGIPVISSRHGSAGITDLKDGVNYRLCDSLDGEVWAAEVESLIEDYSQRKKFSAESKRIVEARYTWESVVSDMSHELQRFRGFS